MNIVIVGQGAIGLLWYRHLTTLSDNEIQLVCSKNLTHLPSHFTFTDLTKKPELILINACAIESIRNPEVILLCVKSFQVVEAIKQLQNIINNKTIIILCHNGMGVAEQLPITIRQKNTILTMLITHGATLNSPFNVKHTGSGKTDIGLVSGILNDQKREQLVNTLNSALPDVFWQENIKQQQWEKLAINCVINPITAIYNISNGDVNQSKYDQIKKQTILEVVAIANTEGIELNSESLLKIIDQVALLTAGNSSSMRSDVLAKRATEVDTINGYVHQLGIKHKISTPQNSLFCQQVKALENKKRSIIK